MINTLFSPQKKCRGKYPLGVYWDSDSKKFCSSMNLMEKHINLGRYDTVEEAFQKYKIYKENFIKNIAEKNKGKIPNKVYEAMMGWIIEIDDWYISMAEIYMVRVSGLPIPYLDNTISR